MGEGIRMHRLVAVVVECLIFLCRLSLVAVRGAAYELGYESDTSGCSEQNKPYFRRAKTLPLIHPRSGLERESSALKSIVGEACLLSFCMFVGFHSTGALLWARPAVLV